ncbi:Retroviral aspartyl protease, partial [Candidatus Geothermarchaeota archaeon]
MGVFRVKARIWNPFKPENAIEVKLIVDTGATYTVLPAKVLEKLGIKAMRITRLRLADNRVLEKPL